MDSCLWSKTFLQYVLSILLSISASFPRAIVGNPSIALTYFFLLIYLCTFKGGILSLTVRFMTPRIHQLDCYCMKICTLSFNILGNTGGWKIVWVYWSLPFLFSKRACNRFLDHTWKKVLEISVMTFPVMDFSIPNLLATDCWKLEVKRIHRTMDMLLHESIDFCSFTQQELNQCN